jgi:hypothetical protein
MLPKLRVRRCALAALVAGMAAMATLEACSSFGSGESPTTLTEAGTGTDSASNADTATPPVDAAVPSVCDGGVHLTESFAGISDPTLFRGWTADPDNPAVLDIALADDIESGVAPPYLRVRSTITGAGTSRATVHYPIAFRPSHLTVAFDVGLGATDMNAEYGCAVTFRDDAGAGTYLFLRTDDFDRRRVIAKAQKTPSAELLGQAIVGTVPMGVPRRMTFQIDLDPGDLASFTTNVKGKDGESTSATPPFQLATAVASTDIQCGLTFVSRTEVGTGSVEVAVGNFELTACP